MNEQLCEACGTGPGAIEDLDAEPPQTWCFGCAEVLLTIGDPVTRYRELAGGGAEYTRQLRERGTTETLRFR
ncbi:hypothetical protein [Kitasatospora viridis]|uniref:Uncharacterized protein n=1 Tax=Kitasatospora viridis TaxID=281105 RepID=A0A561UD76_9ACTN|nr:hypothetical protein [Kitasatospora viridis]TWF97288.1 hypothetical protein FHX73_111068 [Kitasatospora viridis]